MKNALLLFLALNFLSCKQEKKEVVPETVAPKQMAITYAKGFSVEKLPSGITEIKVSSPWPNAEQAFTYALVPKEKMAFITLNKEEYDAIVSVPVTHIVATSTTHISALEALGVEEYLMGFPDTKYISSEKTRKRIAAGKVTELGSNESLNIEMTVALNPDVVFGFGINSEGKAYKTLERSNIPVVYHGGWTEETPLGKSEWIKFFAPFFQLEQKGDSIFNTIKTTYAKAKTIAQNAKKTPTVLSGAMYKDVWYLPGGNSWAAQFLKDAKADYLWEDTSETGSLSLSWENVLNTAQHADFWIGPSSFSSYEEMRQASEHYRQFDAFKNKQVYTFADTKGSTGGLLYYELAPQRPDLVLKDLIYILHPGLLPEYEPFFYKPLK